MKIALVHDFLNKRGGAERVLKEWADTFPDAPIFCLTYNGEVMGDIFDSSRIHTTGLQKWYKLLRYIPGGESLCTRLLLPAIPKAIESINLAGYDIVLSSHTAWCHGVVTPTSTTHICYYHSPMRFAWDYTNEYQESVIGSSRLGKALLSRMLKPIRSWDLIASNRPDICIANAHNVRRRVEKYYSRSAEVVYPPVAVDHIKPTVEKEPYFLIVSTLAAYKRIDIAIRVFNKIDRKLIIVGDGPERRKLQSLAADNVEFKGFLPEEEVDALRAHARAFIFPGEDDFGMAPVEAMAHGTPVIAFDKGGAKEVVIQGKTGIRFKHQTEESLEKGIAAFFAIEETLDPNVIAAHAQAFSKRNFHRAFQRVMRPFIPQK